MVVWSQQRESKLIQKIEAILRMEPPSTKKGAQRLTGRLASLNRFISRSVERNLPFFEVLKLAEVFQWGSAQQKAFEELKQYLIDLTTLTPPAPGAPLLLYVAASHSAVSAALVQEKLEGQTKKQSVDGGTEVTADTVFETDSEVTYYAHWEITEVFSVTVPVTLPLVVDESGEVHTGTAEIINSSTGDVIVSSVSISTKNGWQLVPFDTDMAHEKVDAKLLGFQINDAQTRKTGDAEMFNLTAPWTIAENGRLPISYDAVVSAVSKAITEQEVLSIVFVLEWGGE